jgi:DNA polymerase-3 subunit gamma/tau
MAYAVFALKWRPSDFDQIIGQPQIVSTLKNAIQKNRLAHAYLFSGPRGVGKTSTARILAKALNCKEGPTLSPCQKCSICLEISQGRSLDVIEIDGASNRGIDEIRTLRENVKFSPVQGRFKIYIIDEVHMLTTEAFNALLKTLEEPPEFVKFIFATTQPHKVISTILSRCQRLDFRRIGLMEIVGQLEKIINSEGIAVDKEVLLAIAKSSDGSLRDAESVLDQLVSFSKGRVSLNDAILVLGLVEQEVLFKITDKIIQKDHKGALELFDSLIDSGKDIGVFLSNLIEHFRNLMIAKVTSGDAKLIDLPADICQRLLEQSSAFSLEEIFGTFNILVNTQEISKRLESMRIPLEISLVKLAYDKKGLSNPVLSARPQEKIEQVPLKEKISPVAAKEEVSCNISLESVKDSWQNIVNNLARVKMSVSTYLNEGEPIKIQGNTIVVAFPKNHSLHKESLEKKENRSIIEQSISGLFNADLKVNFILSHETRQKEEGRDHPFVKSALDMFKGRIIKEG